jgi:dGTPase
MSNDSPDDRFWTEIDGVSTSADYKVQFGKDTDRVLYSAAFRRLSYVSQVVGPNETGIFHNRLIHSLKVAQVARRIAHRLREAAAEDDGLSARIEEFGGLDPRVVNAACFAHDLGYPPFGHTAERALQQIHSSSPNADERTPGEFYPAVPSKYALPDGFSSSAQSFRIVTRLAFREPWQRIAGVSDSSLEIASDEEGPSPALNLTRATLAAMLKYPWIRSDQPRGIPRRKWGAYDSERGILEWVTQDLTTRSADIYGKEKSERRSIAAQVVDWADDITYAVHDVEDFFRIGAIPLDELRRSTTLFDEFLTYAFPQVLKKIIVDEGTLRSWLNSKRRLLLPRESYTGSRRDREILHGFAAQLIDDAVTDVSVVDEGILAPSSEQLAVIEMFKLLTWYYVLEGVSLSSVRRGQVRLIRELFRDLISWVEQSYDTAGRRSLPARLINYLDVATQGATTSDHYNERQKISRAVTDYIASLTEAQAVELEARLSGKSVGSTLEGWLNV